MSGYKSLSNKIEKIIIAMILYFSEEIKSLQNRL